MNLNNNSSKSLDQVHQSVDTITKKSFFKRSFLFLGPAFLVSVGYMDPGNWATDIAGGAKYGYSLIWVLIMSNIMALVLQSFAVRLGVVRGLDLAQASKEYFPKPINLALYGLAELAIIACDLAEVLGMAIGLNLLFKIPLLWGVIITFLDTFLLLFFINKGIRKMEAFILSLILLISICFFIEMFLSKPDVGGIALGFIPTLPDSTALYIAIGIIGATVMPHNLYLHSSLVQTRKFGDTITDKWAAIKFNFIDTTVALNLALFVNAGILILAAATFHKNGYFDVAEIKDAYKMLQPLLGTKWASTLFAIALIAAGQSSTLTGTLAGQIVMEGYLNLRIQPWIRRMISRFLAIIPAVFVILLMGENYVGQLLVFSQVILSLQLGFAIIPLIHFVSNKVQMGEFAIPIWQKILGWLITTIIVYLNAQLVVQTIMDWLKTMNNTTIIWLTVVPITFSAFLLLIYIIFIPLFKSKIKQKNHSVHSIKLLELDEKTTAYQKIAVAIDFSEIDSKTINAALNLGVSTTSFLFIHINESVGAKYWGTQSKDLEAIQDENRLIEWVDYLTKKGYHVSYNLSYGEPEILIPKITNIFCADLLVMGTHGHTGIKDLFFGSILNKVKHRLRIPILVVQE